MIHIEVLLSRLTSMTHVAFRLCFGMLFLAVLGACAAPAPPQVSIRAGIGQSVDLDAIRPPSGARYSYGLEADGVQVPVVLQLRSRRRGAKVYDYTGTLNMALPQVENLEEIGANIAQAFRLDDLNVEIRGNQLRVPVQLRTDNRFRSLSSNLVLTESRYSPHDCFAVIGTCKYIATAGPRSIALIAETTEKNGVWTTKTRPDPRQRRAGQRPSTQTLIYSLDKNAVLIDLVLSQSEGGQRSTMVFRRR